jgi:hypothetical protein
LHTLDGVNAEDRSRTCSLVERFEGFACDYQMHCECGRTNRVKADVYWERQSIDALAPCEHCGRDIHFGPAVAALRDADDPALSNDKVANLAWYHTSTFHDWPPASYVAVVGAHLLQVADALHMLSPQVRERALDKALHVGTYEAAIESMLRHMRDENEGDRDFYLHRVSLNLAPTEGACSGPGLLTMKSADGESASRR